MNDLLHLHVLRTSKNQETNYYAENQKGIYIHHFRHISLIGYRVLFYKIKS